MSYLTGVLDLRILLSDQGDDRYVYRHHCFGTLDGSNLNFKTFYRRRVTDFSQPATGGPGLYVDNVLVGFASITSDNTETGEFVFAASAAPGPSDTLEASYYYHWFEDNELQTFLTIASRWLTGSTDFTTTADPLVDALVKYAASQAYTKMAQKWRTYMSQDYRVEDAPKDSPTYNTNDFLQLAKYFRAEALASRTEFFATRQGRALQPLFGSIRGRVRSLGTGSDN